MVTLPRKTAHPTTGSPRVARSGGLTIKGEGASPLGPFSRSATGLGRRLSLLPETTFSQRGWSIACLKFLWCIKQHRTWFHWTDFKHLFHSSWKMKRNSCSSIGHNYRIYSINRPGRLLNFWTLRVGAYSRWALVRGWALIKFSPFSASVLCLFCNKTINGNNKTRRCNKSRFL